MIETKQWKQRAMRRGEMRAVNISSVNLDLGLHIFCSPFLHLASLPIRISNT